jgi:hypothetical protein
MPRKPSHEVDTLPFCEQCKAVCRPGHVLCDQHHAQQLLMAVRRRLVETSATAVEILDELQRTGSQDVALRAAVAILDRAGIRSGVEVSLSAAPDAVSPADQIRARLEKLRAVTDHRGMPQELEAP